MKKTKRSLSLCLLLLLIVSLLITACDEGNSDGTESGGAGENGGNASGGVQGGTQDGESSQDPAENYELFSNLPDITFGGDDFTVLVEGDYMTTYMSVEFMPQADTYDTLKKAVGDRNDLISERFDVKFVEHRTTSYGEMVSTLTTNAVAGVSTYDMVMPYMSDAATLAIEGYFYDLAKLDDIHLNMFYYDQGSVADLSVAGRSYFVTGDLSLLSLACTHAIVFNKDMITEHSLENPYELVLNGDWTIDKLQEMAREVTGDTSDPAGLDYLDTYGFLVNDNFINSLYIGAGQRFTTKNNKDEPIIAITGEAPTRVYDKIYNFVTDVTSTSQFSAAGNSFYTSATAAGKNIWQVATETVAEKRALFRAMAIIDIFDLGEYTCNFGVLPIPKLDKAQEDYFSRVSTVYATCVAIPKNVADLDKSAIITDALMQASTKTTKYAYFETVMTDRKVQDDESAEMLDIIFDGRVYDLASIYHWGGTGEADINAISGFMNAIAISGSNTFTSQWQAIESSVQSAMDDTLDAYLSDPD